MADFLNNPLPLLIFFTLLGMIAIILSILVLVLISKLTKKEEERARIVSRDFEKNLEESASENLKKVIVSLEASLQEAGDTAKTKILDSLDESLNGFQAKLVSLDEKIQKDIANFGKIDQEVREALLRSVEEFPRQLSQEVKKEIELYKKERIAEIERTIYLILGEVAKKTIGRAIDFSVHEELVMDALEKAKKENFFN